ncbi:DUF4225 domain-containing protein [Pantoea agglomerans]|uniref:DUF4225 domain-containing protein n=1 Tax=Enterobacter agglomerans TaxID=549 RepID=UPI001781798C|nr:DUF4225 domain-containing protein [Pantoea agglomerans]MBD8133758.1 DUF4225 domain-containing protein [Pantoea agglomerans]MBD8145856.1 DUF4225 domain-containing protein [Pantoea agglomerans]WVL82647.1 DUF4225 domain-containing protein [Pantoea agglomerans]WVL83597.1 DUF4225 domain-containing protein [Pantoea agglomerans]WVL87967.1 DUF4225 domain-containing protein [Pantoea agglomerans]
MDAALLDMMRSGGRNKAWAETMVNLEARKLINTANRLSAFHLQDGLTRINFVQEIKQVVEQQFAAARRAKSDEECIACINNLRVETGNLEEQGRMLRMKTAKLYAKVEFVRENNKIVGYVISAVKIVVSGMAIFGGGVMIATGTPLGILSGAILITDGINQISKEAINLSKISDSKSEGIIADQTMEIAKFMGFKPESGLAVYNSISLAASVYSIVGLSRRPEAWRLFRYLPGDFYRKVNTISKPKLTMKIAGYGVKAKVIFDLISTDNN